MRHRVLILTIFTLLLFSLCPADPVSASRPAGQLAPLPDAERGPHPPIHVVLSWSGQAGPGQTVQLTAEIIPDIAADELTLSWTVPEGTYLDGATHESLGPAAAGHKVVRQRALTLGQEGTFKVLVGAQIRVGGRPDYYGDADVLFFTIRAGAAASVSRRGPGIASTSEQIPAPNLRVSPTAHPEQGFWVRGCFVYEDKPLTDSGPGTPVNRPARRVKVELWEEDDIDDDHDGTTYAGEDGCFSIWDPDNDDGLGGGNKEVYLKIYPDNAGGYVTDSSWSDTPYYCYTPVVAGGQDIDYGTLAPTNFGPMFNIADVLLDAQRYAAAQGLSLEPIKVHYEPDYTEEDGSYFIPFWDEITISETPSDDGYDDTVIAHEYGHYVGHYYCDDSPGGEHGLRSHISAALAWSEGWASYYSSALRNSSLYLDWEWNSGAWEVNVDWETWPHANNLSGIDNESVVVATLWDLHDAANEPHDRLSLGVDEIWDTYTGGMRRDYPACTILGFYNVWLQRNHPGDSELAAIFAYNLGDRAFGGLTMAGRPDFWVDGTPPWNLISFATDTSRSMAGDKIAAVKSVIQDQVTRMDNDPNPYEFDVDAFIDGSYSVISSFFPDIVNPAVAGITTEDVDVPASRVFYYLKYANMHNLGITTWLFVDGPTSNYGTDPTLEEITGILQQRRTTPYIIFFGDCSGAQAGRAATDEVRRPRAWPTDWTYLPRFGPDDLGTCIEPYLQLVQATQGQFLLIAPNQVNDAAEIVRTFMSHGAGAGRWASYVSTDWTYTWAERDAQWYDATGGTYYNFSNYATIPLPQAFTFYGTPYSSLYATAPGYVSFTGADVVRANHGIPYTDVPNGAIYAFWDNISAYVPGQKGGPEGLTGVYTAYDAANNRFVIEYHEAYHMSNPSQIETFEIILDYDTNQILLQYNQVTDDSHCTVGVENPAGWVGTQVYYNTPGSLHAGHAVELIPLPPHPYNDHNVLVDSHMTGVAFLLNGYSGNTYMTLYRPNGNPVNPDDPDLRRIDLGRVKYYYITNPIAGTWRARVEGEGTYNFTSVGGGSFYPRVRSDLSMTAAVPNTILVDLNELVDSATFSLIRTGDGAHEDDLQLYDDGMHDDGAALDGLYGGTYTAGKAGTYYIQVDGVLKGESFRRIVLLPLRFQEMELRAPWPDSVFAAPGSTVEHHFTLYNDSPDNHDFSLTLASSLGWATLPIGNVTVPGNGSATVVVNVQVPAGAWGQMERTTLTAQADEMADSAIVTTTARGPVSSIGLVAQPQRIAPNGRQSIIVAQFNDAGDWSVADGTPVYFSTDLGAVSPAFATTVNGVATTTLTSDGNSGIATVWVSAGQQVLGGGLPIAVEISPATAYEITLKAAADWLPPDGTSTTALEAYVRDKYGGLVPDGTAVRFSVAGDDQRMGSISGLEVYTATTSGGTAVATYRSGTQAGIAKVSAAISLDGTGSGGEGSAAWRRDTVQIWLYSSPLQRVYLPLVFRGR